jgi:Ca2+-binding EF-hand superfamily protein
MQTDKWWVFWSKVCWVGAGWIGLALAVSLWAMLAGCNTGTYPAKVVAPPAAPVAKAPPAKATTPAAAAPTTPPAATTPSEAPTEKGTSEVATKSVPAESTAPEKAAEPAPPAFGTERVLLLAPRNPVLIDFQLSIDGRPHTTAMDRLVEEVLKLADTDGDGRPTWKEIVASKRFKYGQFGNLPIASENEYKQIIERYDVDRDGVADAGELPRFLTRNAGSARSFSVRGTADFRHARGRGSPLWGILDVDDDGAISAEERAAAPGALLTRDTDDDEILLSGDLNPQVVLDPGMMGSRRRAGPTIIRLLGSHTDWDSVRSSLEEHYAGGGYLRADSFPLTPELFSQLDANGDGKILKAEFARLNEVPPHIVLGVSFGKPHEPEPEKREGEAREGEAPAEPPANDEKPANEKPADDQPAVPASPSVKLVSLIPALGETQPLLEQPGRLTFRVAETTITVYLNDSVSGGNFAEQAQQILLALDGDKNGYLEKSEVPENGAPQLGQFDAVDTDEDGKVYLAEIVAFLEQQQAGLRAQIHAKASDREDALFAALDQNHDQRLDAREIEQVPERLAALDASGDGLLTSDEIPESLVIGLARGSLENMDALFVLPPLVVRATAADTPRWFTAMDANGDGAISRREFLGAHDTFVGLDTNGDGLLDAAEAKGAVGQAAN